MCDVNNKQVAILVSMASMQLDFCVDWFELDWFDGIFEDQIQLVPLLETMVQDGVLDCRGMMYRIHPEFRIHVDNQKLSPKEFILYARESEHLDDELCEMSTL